MADNDLSDDQIQQLLRDAEERMRNAKQVIISDDSSSKFSLPNLGKSATSAIAPYIKSTGQTTHVDSSQLVPAKDRKLANSVRTVEDPIVTKAKALKAKKSTAGAKWFNMPKTVVTPELKRDLQLLRLRSVLDPKRFYKKDTTRAEVPEYSQVGTVIEGPTEYFSSRLTNKERKQTFVEQVLATEQANHKFRNKYNDIQAAKASGKKEHYKKMKALRKRR
ncbi:11068252-94a7-42a9-ad6d-ea5fa3bdeb1b [Sclerotinia trifoliorum]|uniref:11068252-94a7-42a9-ad6d-ea5fa3bdeb1b n=1 Tax=Sclerotinia trifoliorum TaxID=28548 RepID=A0A8H2VLL1_9HELO|nr:11068252-94a7-42a9-ad6d-ea5fa3bdeb1b [Sclerotinia trifoliorum]